ncbi:MAG: outer membrane beta-barrel protein [Pseudomonadota bacterium]
MLRTGMICAFAVAAVLSSQPARAQDDCIENSVGVTVCGRDAEAVRARMRAEQEFYGGKKIPNPGASSSPVGAAAPDAPRVRPAAAAQEGPRGQAAPVRPPRAARARSRSVYDAFGPRASVRGGYAFAGHATGGDDFDVSGLTGAVAYIHPMHRIFLGTISIEGEIAYFRDREEASVLGSTLQSTIWGVAPLFGVRWDLNPAGKINPFASVSGGGAYTEASVDDGAISFADGQITLAYGGRGGIETRLTDRLSVEAAYRYIGFTRDGTLGVHSAEIGLNYGF